MKKDYLIILFVVMITVFIQGCRSSHASSGPDTRGKIAYPVGHDMHPGTKKDRHEDKGHPLPGYS